jgi:hypothetical protein
METRETTTMIRIVTLIATNRRISAEADTMEAETKEATDVAEAATETVTRTTTTIAEGAEAIPAAAPRARVPEATTDAVEAAVGVVAEEAVEAGAEEEAVWRKCVSPKVRAEGSFLRSAPTTRATTRDRNWLTSICSRSLIPTLRRWSP